MKALSRAAGSLRDFLASSRGAWLGSDSFVYFHTQSGLTGYVLWADLADDTRNRQPRSPSSFLALTGEPKRFEADLAETLGPEEAHRVTYADGMCMGSSIFSGAGPRGGDAPKK